MNDLRSSRKPAAVPEKSQQPTITRTPPRSRPVAGELDEDTKELRRRKARPKRQPGKARRRAPAPVPTSTKQRRKQGQQKVQKVANSQPDADITEQLETQTLDSLTPQTELTRSVPLQSESNQSGSVQPEAVVAANEVAASGAADQTIEVEIPLSRPTRRRDAESEGDAKFPWHHQFADDEPEELQATSPLLSRAFRATTG